MPDTVTPTTTTFELPSLGADMEYGTVLEWRVAVGDAVKRGDVVALVSTEKSDIDVEIWQSGTIVEFLAEIGREVPVGTALLVLRSDEPPADEPPDAPAPAPDVTAPPVAAPAVPIATAPARVIATDRQLSSPLARSLAAERGIDLATIAGTGPGGAVLARDVAAPAATAPPVAQAPAPRQSPPIAAADGPRRVIAERMAKANTEIPHYFLDLDVDMGPGLAWLERHNIDRPPSERVLPAALFIRAVARAVAATPALNGFWVDGGFRSGDDIAVAMAISLRTGGLVTPCIHDADELDLDELMASLKERVQGARAGFLRSSWMTGATITVSNLGDNGADRVGGVVFPPQVALVGFGSVRERPWVVDGELAVRPIVTVSLAADHRATDGATGSRFLKALAHHLTHPEES